MKTTYRKQVNSAGRREKYKRVVKDGKTSLYYSCIVHAPWGWTPWEKVLEVDRPTSLGHIVALLKVKELEFYERGFFTRANIKVCG